MFLIIQYSPRLSLFDQTCGKTKQSNIVNVYNLKYFFSSLKYVIM